jgi:hypothetical protein
MISLNRFRLAVAAFTVLLTGCSTVGPSFNDMTKAYTASIEQHTRDNILVNMMRAGFDMPMTFTDIPSVLGTGIVGTEAGLSVNNLSTSPGSLASYFSAGAGSNYTAGASLSTSRQFNFTLSSLDNQQFTKGFLTTIPLDNVHFFSRSSHLSKQLLYTLLIDSIEIKVKDAPNRLYVNNPNRSDYHEFQKILFELLQSGLTTETVTDSKELGPQMSESQAVKLMGELGKTLIDAKKAGANIEVKSTTVAGQKRFQLQASKQRVRFCVSPPPQQTWIRERFGSQILCKPSPGQAMLNSNTGAAPADQANKKPVELMTITLRSTRDVFRFVGQVIMAQTDRNPPDVISIRTNTGKDQWEDIPLLVVNKGRTGFGEQTIASVVYFGETYSVPLKDNGYSAVVFDLLSLLVTMNKIPGSIPASPGILIK